MINTVKTSKTISAVDFNKARELIAWDKARPAFFKQSDSESEYMDELVANLVGEDPDALVSYRIVDDSTITVTMKAFTDTVMTIVTITKE